MDTRQQDASPARSGSGDPGRRRRRASRRARAAGLKTRPRPGDLTPRPGDLKPRPGGLKSRRAGFAPPLTALTASRAPSHAISAAS